MIKNKRDGTQPTPAEKKITIGITPNRHRVKNGAAKWNFPLLKAQFMASEYMEVTSFFLNEVGEYTFQIKNKTKGWAIEKQKKDKELAAKILAEAEKRREEELTKALNNAITGVKMRLATPEQLRELSARDLKTYWEILRTELGKPTKIIDRRTDGTIEKGGVIVYLPGTDQTETVIEQIDPK